MELSREKCTLGPWLINLLRPRAHTQAEAIINFCENSDKNNLIWHDTAEPFISACRSGWKRLQDISANWRFHQLPNDNELRNSLELFQVLVATNQLVAAYNTYGMEQFMPSYGTAPSLSHGCPLMVTLNEPHLNLANGDMGIAIGDGPTPAIGALFPGMDAALPLSRLPQWTPAFAMTIHKSQGSEWQQVAIDFGRRPSPLLDRRLCYTAVTRASGSLILSGSREALAMALAS